MSEPREPGIPMSPLERVRWKLADYITDGLRRGSFKRKDDLVEAHWELEQLVVELVEITRRPLELKIARLEGQLRDVRAILVALVNKSHAGETGAERVAPENPDECGRDPG